MPLVINTSGENLQADGNSASVAWKGGSGTLFVDGVLGGGTVKLQRQRLDASDNWVDVGADVQLQSEGAGNFSIGACTLRVNLSGATSPNLDVYIRDNGLGKRQVS